MPLTFNFQPTDSPAKRPSGQAGDPPKGSALCFLVHFGGAGWARYNSIELACIVYEKLGIVAESNLPSIQQYLPSEGMVFHTDSEQSLAAVSADLCRIASFLQNHEPSKELQRFHDWWEHDGLHFPHGEIDFHELFQLIGTPRWLIESMTGDHRVFNALSPLDRRWYLQFYADWDDDDANLVGEYSIVVENKLVDLFAEKVTPKLICPTTGENVLTYFLRIEA